MADRHGPSTLSLVSLGWIRWLQIVVAAVIIASTLYLVAALKIHRSSFGGAVTVPIIMAGVTLILTVIAQWNGIRASGYQDGGCLITFIVMDAHCIGLQIPSLVVLAVAGLPSNCNGVASGPESIIYSVSEHALRAKYCTIPKLDYWLAIFSILGYIYTIGLEIRQVITVNRGRRSNEVRNRNEHANVDDSERADADAKDHAPSLCLTSSRCQTSDHGRVHSSQSSDDTNTWSSAQEADPVPMEAPPPYIRDAK
ncbi:hypothetical protein VFPPC_11643 [Pochonia chlamydosporia 170]|uniref:Uncharacterized protein n=1 Tax=Pochonia chlamydosporia 170 TaxID=1380566 RepID=A0A179EYP0_METCM|nr:hypothetical protein VFPPC_11643 [Pochonia chlamydosporia 170]OAQ58304.1 hypothetical protein VFPPC_11643 [Pochonia chlamydosporia 170]